MRTVKISPRNHAGRLNLFMLKHVVMNGTQNNEKNILKALSVVDFYQDDYIISDGVDIFTK